MTVAYDPRTKKRIRAALHEALYGPIKVELDAKLHNLVIKNSSIYKNDQHCFKYKGEMYMQDPAKLIPRPVNWLHKDLYTDMELYLDEKRSLENDEMPHVLGFITQVLNSSDSFKDYFRLLPESIHFVLKRIEAECPCRKDALNQTQIDRIQRQNIHSLNLMRKRITINLLLAR